MPSDLDESFAKLVFARYLKDYGWVIELADLHSFSPLILDDIRQLIERSPHMTSEKEPFSFSIVGSKPGLHLASAPVTVQPFHLSKAGRLSDVKNAVDGIHTCYLVDENGMLSIVEVPDKCRKATAGETMSELSRDTQSLAFYVGIDLARVYSNGLPVRTCRKGVWLKPCHIKFEELSKEGYPERLLAKVMNLCVSLSESCKPGTIVLQEGDKIESCKPFKQIQFTECNLDSLSAKQLTDYAEMDGAVIITVRERVLGIAQRLIYPELGGGGVGGARHESASRYSARHECVVFVVSSDGPISIFRGGDLWGKCFAELKP